MWTVTRQPRSKGLYYSAQWGGEIPRRGVTLGLMPGDPPTMAITQRLRGLDPSGCGTDAEVRIICRAHDDAAAEFEVMLKFADGKIPNRLLLAVGRAIQAEVVRAGIASLTQPARASSLPPVVGDAQVPALAAGAMLTLAAYVEAVWKPIRSKQVSTWEREKWWWNERILPALGQTLLADLDAQKWTAFLGTLEVGGNSKRLCQTTYRTALTHASEVLGWITGHKFRKIVGSTKRSLPEPEPMNQDELDVFLPASPTPTHRAMFAAHFGQGLRPGETIRLDWAGASWSARTLHVPGTKNSLANGTVPMTKLTYQELWAYWNSLGQPAEGPMFLKSDGTPYAGFPDGAFRSTASRAGLNEHRVRKVFPYSGRHTFATIAATKGIDRAFTKDMMRHSRASTVLDEAYIRVSRKQTADAFSDFGMK